MANISDYSGDLSFGNITIVDTGQCSNPVCAYNIVYWQRFENNESHIYKAEKENDNWSDPQAVYFNGDNVDLSMTRVLWDEFDEPSVIWENNGQIMYYNTYNEEVDTIGLNGIDSAFQASSFYYFVLTADNYPATLSLSSGTGMNQEIYVLDNSWGSTLVNISNNNVKDSHSKLFEGPSIGSEWLFYCIWQSQINGHTVLYCSTESIIIGDIEETRNNSSLNVYPNPFNQELQIDFLSQGNETITIEIYAITGERVLSREIQGKPNTRQSIQWKQDKGESSIPGGIYFIKLKQGQKEEIRKVICTK